MACRRSDAPEPSHGQSQPLEPCFASIIGRQGTRWLKPAAPAGPGSTLATAILSRPIMRPASPSWPCGSPLSRKPLVGPAITNSDSNTASNAAPRPQPSMTLSDRCALRASPLQRLCSPSDWARTISGHPPCMLHMDIIILACTCLMPKPQELPEHLFQAGTEPDGSGGAPAHLRNS